MFFTREKLRCFLQGENYGLFLQGKITDFFNKKLRTFLHFLVKITVFFTREKLRTFLQVKTIKEQWFFTGKL